MKNLLVMLAAVVTLTACDKDENGGGSPGNPTPLPVTGLSCDLYDFNTLRPSTLPVFEDPSSSTVITGTVYAGEPVGSFVLNGVLDFVDASVLLVDSGFSMTEWFGLNCKAKFMITEAAVYSFKLTSDDGTKLYVDNYKLITNDGHHGATMKSSSMAMSAGEHELTLQFMQGNGPIALKLESNLTVEFYH